MLKNIFLRGITALLGVGMMTCCDGTRSETKNPENLARGSVVPIDTITVKYSGVTLLAADWSGNKILYFDFFTPEIVISDLKGNILSQFNAGLLGMNDLGDHIYGAHFLDQSTVAIVTEKGYYITDLNGNVRQRYIHPFDLNVGVYMNGDFHLDYDSKHKSFVSLLKTTSLSSINRHDFYTELRHLTVFNLDSNTYTFRIPYEQGSYYLNEKYFNNEFGPHFALHGDSVSVIYPLDPGVYTYSLNDYKLLRSFDTKPDSFRHVVKFPFGGGTIETKERLTGFANSVNYRLFSEGDTIINSYTSGIPSTFFENVNDIEQYNAGSYKHLKYYLQMFVNGEKQISDFELPKQFPMISLYKKGEMILTEQEKWMPHSDGHKRFLYCRLTVEPAAY